MPEQLTQNRNFFSDSAHAAEYEVVRSDDSDRYWPLNFAAAAETTSQCDLEHERRVRGEIPRADLSMPRIIGLLSHVPSHSAITPAEDTQSLGTQLA